METEAFTPAIGLSASAAVMLKTFPIFVQHLFNGELRDVKESEQVG